MVVSEGVGTWRNLIPCTVLLIRIRSWKKGNVWFWSDLKKKTNPPQTWEMASWSRIGLLVKMAKRNSHNYNFCNAEDQSWILSWFFTYGILWITCGYDVAYLKAKQKLRSPHSILLAVVLIIPVERNSTSVIFQCHYNYFFLFSFSAALNEKVTVISTQWRNTDLTFCVLPDSWTLKKFLSVGDIWNIR